MATRREGREIVMQLLFSVDILKLSKEEAYSSFFEISENKNKNRQDLLKIKEFVDDLFFGTLENIDVIDEQLVKILKNWELARVASVDRAVLRMATYELLFKHDVPVKVVINEAVDIAKDFSTDESGKFVNGILDKLKAKRGV